MLLIQSQGTLKRVKNLKGKVLDCLSDKQPKKVRSIAQRLVNLLNNAISSSRPLFDLGPNVDPTLTYFSPWL